MSWVQSVFLAPGAYGAGGANHISNHDFWRRFDLWRCYQCGVLTVHGVGPPEVPAGLGTGGLLAAEVRRLPVREGLHVEGLVRKRGL